MVARYRRWFEYEKDAHEKVIASLDSVPPEARADEAFQKAVSLFAHLLAGRWMWLYPLGHAEKPPTDFFPSQVHLPSLAEAMNQAWSTYFDSLYAAGFQRMLAAFRYRRQMINGETNALRAFVIIGRVYKTRSR